MLSSLLEADAVGAGLACWSGNYSYKSSKMASEFLKADIAELKALRAKATRLRSQTALDAALASASAALADLPPEVPLEPTPETAATEVPEVNGEVAQSRLAAQATNSKPSAPTLTPGAFVSIGTFGFDPGAYDSPWVNTSIDSGNRGELYVISRYFHHDVYSTNKHPFVTLFEA